MTTITERGNDDANRVVGWVFVFLGLAVASAVIYTQLTAATSVAGAASVIIGWATVPLLYFSPRIVRRIAAVVAASPVLQRVLLVAAAVIFLMLSGIG